GLEVFAKDVFHHPTGNVKQYTYGNGLTESVGFDPRGRVASITSGPLSLTYDVDHAGNVSAIHDLRDGMSSSLTYDDIDRLWVVNGFGAAQLEYDDAGNRKTKWAGPYTFTYHYDDGRGRLTSITTDAPTGSGSFDYDAIGNMKIDPS